MAGLAVPDRAHHTVRAIVPGCLAGIHAFSTSRPSFEWPTHRCWLPVGSPFGSSFPVTPGHLLAIPRRHVGTWFDLHRPEQHAVNELVRQGRVLTRDSDRTVAGFNVGINDGDVAGQTVAHCHVHLIPRRTADVANPRGGVRNIIPGKGDYAAS